MEVYAVGLRIQEVVALRKAGTGDRSWRLGKTSQRGHISEDLMT